MKLRSNGAEYPSRRAHPRVCLKKLSAQGVPMTTRRRPNDIAVYFNEGQPFDLTILSAVERIREGRSLSRGSAAKRLLTLGALIVRGADARLFISSMGLGGMGERLRLEQRLRGERSESQPGPIRGATQEGGARTMTERRKSNEVTVYFNEQEQPFDSTILSAVVELREGTSLSKASAAKRVMALGAVVLGGVDARPFVQIMKLGAASERWALDQQCSRGSVSTPAGNPDAAVTASVLAVDRGPAQIPSHSSVAAASSALSKPIEVCEEFQRSGMETQHIAPPAVSQSPAKGSLSRLKGMATSHSVEELCGTGT